MDEDRRRTNDLLRIMGFITVGCLCAFPMFLLTPSSCTEGCDANARMAAIFLVPIAAVVTLAWAGGRLNKGRPGQQVASAGLAVVIVLVAIAWGA